jgi:hypothetical protein
MRNISGGFYLKARRVRDSAIYKSPPHVREIWDWLLMNANFKDNGTLKRGQVITSYNEILEDLSWFVGYRKESYKKHHCETALKLLVKEQMVATQKTTRGVLVTVLNYDKYQDASSYETDSESYKKTATEPQQSRTKSEECKNVKKEEDICGSSGEENKPKRKVFVNPTIEEVTEYCRQRKNTVNPIKFHSFYESKVWMVGKNKMKDWKKAVITWEQGDNSKGAAPQKKGSCTQCANNYLPACKGKSEEERARCNHFAEVEA